MGRIAENWKCNHYLHCKVGMIKPLLDMDDNMKLNWEMRYQWYPNDRILKGFENLLTAYLQNDRGRILDIGCGQSDYILDMLDSKFELFAQDEESFQIDYLQRRIRNKGFPIERVNYCTSRFPQTEFIGKFEGVVVSNILHFYSLEEIQTSILPPLVNLLKPGSILCVTVHSTKHVSAKLPITDESYFKHFFSRADLNQLFPIERYQTLYYQVKSCHTTVYEEEFIRAWLKKVYNNHQIYDGKRILKAQNDYLKNGRIDNITVVYKMKN